MTLLSYFRQPYPVATNRWKIIVPISLFISFFFLMFQPYGLGDTDNSGKWLILGGYGLVTFLVLVVDMFFIPWLFGKPFHEAQWTIGKELLFLLFILLSIGIANLFYTSLFFSIRITFHSFLIFLLYTAAIGIIPITALTLVKHSYLLKQNQKLAATLSHSVEERKKVVAVSQPKEDPEGSLHFVSESDNEELFIDDKDLLLVDAEGNYITVVYREGKQNRKILLRNTLAYAQEVTKSLPNIIKCHRSFLVNIDYITKIAGNSQGYQLHLDGYDQEVPVARSQTNTLKEAISAKN
jgi:DNA-binding LytR/AlgR family response regulator